MSSQSGPGSARRARRHRGGHEEEHENHERWLISYADMITLLMVFFIVLFSMSVLDASKYRAVAESFAEAIGGGPTDALPVINETAPTSPDGTAENDNVINAQTPEDLAAQLEQKIADADLTKDVKVITDERGVVLLLTNSLLFEEARALLLPKGRDVLGRLIPIVAAQGKPLVVEGHTDSQPINTGQFPSNWELSTTRATNVLRFMLSRGVPPTSLTAAGYADTHPRGANQTETGRAANRRVEIILVVAPSDARPAVALQSAQGPPAAPAAQAPAADGSGS
jgi:chemotaxis protein MotB